LTISRQQYQCNCRHKQIDTDTEEAKIMAFREPEPIGSHISINEGMLKQVLIVWDILYPMKEEII
jgi:hypothetical protein